jgi:hypothetical protein
MKYKMEEMENRFNSLETYVHMLEERVVYLESIIMNMSTSNKNYEFDEIRTSIVITEMHLAQVLQTSMEEQIIAIIVEENRKRPFIKMMKDLCMFKNQWIRMDDSDLILLIRTIEHKILLLHSQCPADPEKSFDNTNIIYGLNLGRFKKIKNKLIESI